MMQPIKEDPVFVTPRTDSSINLLFYLSVEFLIGLALSAVLTVLDIIKSFLPKPPRDLTGNVVLVTGVSSTLGESIAKEFASNGCSVVCVDNDIRSVKEIAINLRSRDRRIEGIGPNHRKRENVQNTTPMILAYKCDLLNRDAIRNLSRQVEEDIGGIDVLVTCVGFPNQDIFDTASKTLMSHYWTILAFIPFMLRRAKAHIVGVTPVSSMQDAYFSSRVAINGLMESLGQHLSNHSSHFTFLSVSPTHRAHSSIRQYEHQMAKDIVEAVRRDQPSITISWISKMLYEISCMIYNVITMATQWIHTQGCDYSL